MPGKGRIVVSLRAKNVLSTLLLATVAALTALVLLRRSIAASPAGERLWDVLVVCCLAAALSMGATWIAVQRLTLPLRRLAQTLSGMARSGKLRSDFASAGGSREVRLIEATCRALLTSLEESRLARERSYVEALGAVLTAADARDHEMAGHSFRVALYSVALGRAMGLDEEQLKAIEWGALLHDVGKMVIPDEILRKGGPLAANEWLVMKQHPVWGLEMMAEVSFLQPAALDIIHSHHERWDGTGYPRGLAGERIPLAARVFAVMDAYDAITSDRPYRRARGHSQAVIELKRVAGQQLDPRIVAAFCDISEVELRRMRELCDSVHPGLRIPDHVLDSLAEAAGTGGELRSQLG